MDKQQRIKFIISAVAFLLCLTCLSAYAWFAKSTNSGKINLSAADQGDELVLQIGRVPSKGNNLDYPDVSYTFNEKIEAGGTFNYYPGKTTLGSTVNMQNITFGKIDNLAVLKPENIVYLRLTIPNDIGNTLVFSLSYADPEARGNHLGFSEYKSDGDITNTEGSPIAELRKIEIPENATTTEALCSFINYQWFVSTTPYDGGAALEAANPNWSDPINMFQHGYVDPDVSKTLNSPISSPDNASADNSKDSHIYPDILGDALNTPHYLYIKLTPDLDTYAEAMNLITKYPVSFMTFNITMHVEVRNNNAEETTTATTGN